MVFHPIDVTVPHVAYAALGGFVVLFGMFSLLLRERLYIGEACWSFLFGVVIGPYGANIFNPRGWAGDNVETVNTITLEFSRVVLAIGVFAIGVELPKAYMRRHWQSLFFLLGPIMIWGWLVSAGFIFALIPGLNFLSSLVVAACLTPTDPILAAAVVGGKYADKHVPAHIRHLLAAESGCNDGAAFPFLYLAIYLILDHSTNDAMKDWFLKLWLYQIILGVVIGSLIGFAFRYLMKFSERHTLIDRHSYVAQYVSLALLTIGLTTLLGSDDLLSAFACGAAFAWDGFFNRQTEESVFSSVIDLLFNVAAFVYIGAWMPFGSFSDPEGTTLQVWRLIVIAILVLLFRRLPAMIAFYRWIPDIKTFREAIFSGHFGPIGVGAVFISTLATEVLQESPMAEENEQVALLIKTIQPICAFMVLCSIAVHGLSIPGFSLGRRVHSVSRTWSRHTGTAHAQQPDWLDQVRKAEGGIVVNRDPNRDPNRIADLEEGTGFSGPEKDTVNGRLQEEIEIDRKQHSESPTVVSSDKDQKQRQVEAGLTPEGDVPPDGEELVSEWQEGHHRIIERRAGPGEEVEVEVIRNVDGEDISSAYRGSEAVVHKMMDRLKGAPKTVEMDLEALGKSIEERISKSPLPGFYHHKDQVEDDDDDGWASEDSNKATHPTPLAGSSRRPRSKSPKTKSGAKRRASTGLKSLAVRDRAPPTASLPAVVTSPPPVDLPGDDSPSVSIPARPPLSPHPSVSATDYAYPSAARRIGRQSRLDSLRADVATSRRGSRDVSPARSVRFAEHDSQRPGSGSGTNTPRAVMFGDDVHGEDGARSG
ncbi:Na-H-Exchanger domain-containing protein [Mycena indigotica]|uniref:Na-H-Exchanger domain-containing protein n=1 Tax=Mycena indigotica TaxID=2126181 RepID=A0A8H6SJC7_9AGAR|nr:Na-H-Exchanger domain-containing protein [Mycena indigotica]KAF7299367.1 Na-H-Exchanger domain-containing protein [Mycena indigotica]